MSRLTIFLREAHRSMVQRSKILRNEFTEHTKVVARMIERHNLPAEGWGAKGFEFWTFLSVLLARTNYSRILELGSGRSTIVFAEFAKVRNASVTSIETDRQWYNKARMELRWQNLSDDLIHLLKFDESVRWYNVEQFRSLA